MTFPTIIHRTFLGNDARAWATALGVLVVVMTALMLVRRVVRNHLAAVAARTSTDIDDFVVDLLRRTHPLFLLLVALSSATLALQLPSGTRGHVKTVLFAGLITQMVLWGNELIAFWVRRYTRGPMAVEAGAQTTITAMAFLARLVLWALFLLLLLQNFGVQVTALITTLGVSGIAVALAAQSVLGDVFAAMSIFLDKPFVIGDFIIVDDFLGSVEYVGLRSTRIKSLSGEQIVMANSDLMKSRIRNFKRMAERRVVFQIGVVENLPYETVARIPGMIREAVLAQANVRFDRSHFKEYGDYSLNFETVYYVLSADYNLYMDIQQAINLALFRRFADEGIGFAYPTRTVIMSGDLALGGGPGLAPLDSGLREEVKR
ncbi:MAG TPA: mechanosensitive ion channel family protein [Gemmatimonadaceae bacterium]